MGYYIRVLSTSVDSISLTSLEAGLKKESLQGKIVADEGIDEEWEQITLCHVDGHPIASIERCIVEDQSLAEEELSEFREMIEDCKPTNAVNWLIDYFSRVRCIYAFQLLSGTEHKGGWEILGHVKGAIWSIAPGILQADDEGFSNEAGYHILWQFNDNVEGDWWMGVLCNSGWTHFQMDLGNLEHRAMFLQGNVPPGVILA